MELVIKVTGELKSEAKDGDEMQRLTSAPQGLEAHQGKGCYQTSKVGGICGTSWRG